MRARQGTKATGPSFCWVCFAQLQRAPGEGQGLFFFHLVQDPAGHEHRVHGGQCIKDAVEQGCTVIKGRIK